MKIQYQEVAMKTVIDFWMNAYEVPVVQYEWFFDAAKGRLVLKLYTEQDAPLAPDDQS